MTMRSSAPQLTVNLTAAMCFFSFPEAAVVARHRILVHFSPAAVFLFENCLEQQLERDTVEETRGLKPLLAAAFSFLFFLALQLIHDHCSTTSSTLLCGASALTRGRPTVPSRAPFLGLVGEKWKEGKVLRVLLSGRANFAALERHLVNGSSFTASKWHAAPLMKLLCRDLTSILRWHVICLLPLPHRATVHVSHLLFQLIVTSRSSS